jgi:MtrB/PioB family decaheme-associated outer membrane protein
MLSLTLVSVICCSGLAAPAAMTSQAVAQQTASSAPPAQSGAAPQTKPTEPPQTPTPPATASEAAEPSRGLFEQTWEQFEIGGRFSSIDGDPARFQRYADIRDGILFTDARYAREHPDGTWAYRVGADNVGWRDQRFFGDYERPGRFSISGLWDEIPQFYSVDTKTPYATSGDALVLDDATQLAVQSSGGNLNPYVPVASQFDLHERRDIGFVSFIATPTPQLDVKATYTMQRHVGELPWGASFGFSNDVEVALPYDSRTNDFSLGTEWNNNRGMVRVAYTGSWFNNLDDTLVWDSPKQLNDTTSAPGRGRMALWPSNSAQTISAAGLAKFARRTQLTGFVSLGFWNNDEPLQPFTINPTLQQLPLPRTNAEGQARVFSTNLNLVSRPVMEWRFSTRLRMYDYNNETPRADIPQFINYDTSVTTSSTGGPRLYAYSRTTWDADATWTGLAPVALTAGYTYNGNAYDFRVFEDTGEHTLRLTADAVGSQWVTFRAQYEIADRSGSGLDESLLTQTGEQPLMRHYDVANRVRNRFSGQVDVVPNDFWIFSASAGLGGDDYDDSYFGLQESSFRQFSIGADYRAASGLGAGVTYSYERYTGFQRSRSANPDGIQNNDPRRDWTADSTEDVDYFSIYLTPPRIGQNTEARLSYDFSYAEGRYVYAIPPGSPLVTPNQLPKVYNKLQQLHVDVRHRLTNRLAASVSYLYEPFRVYDFAFDPTVVNSIVQPSSLVLGYVYRPYTAHAASIGLRYFW